MAERHGESKTDRTGDLAELVTAEQRLEVRLQQARQQASTILAEASEHGAALRRAYDEEAAAAQASFTANIEQARRVESARLIAGGAQRAARYDQTTETLVEHLSDLVLTSLLDRSHS